MISGLQGQQSSYDERSIRGVCGYRNHVRNPPRHGSSQVGGTRIPSTKKDEPCVRQRFPPPIFVAMFTPGFLSPGQRQGAAPVDHNNQRITETNPCDPAAVFTSKNQSLQSSVRIKKGVRQEMP
jgi:hypothetical protein